MQRSLPDLFVDRSQHTDAFRKMLDGRTRRRIMLLEAGPGMGKSWLIHMFAHEVKSRGLPLVHIDFADRQSYDTLMLVRRCRDSFGPAHFNPLTQTINSVTALSDARSVPDTSDAHMSETYRRYETGLVQLLSQLGSDHASYADALILQHRLTENITHCRRHGDTEDRRSERSVIIEQLNRLASSVLGLTFNEVCQNLQTQIRGEISIKMIKDKFFVIRTNDPLERQAIEDRINTDFFDCLNQLCGQSAVIFLFDSYERNSLKPDLWLSGAADRWICNQLLARIRDEKLANAVAVVAGRLVPKFGADWNTILGRKSLEQLEHSDVKEYLRGRLGLSVITDDVIERLWQVGANIPETLGLFGDRLLTAIEPQAQDDEW